MPFERSAPLSAALTFVLLASPAAVHAQDTDVCLPDPSLPSLETVDVFYDFLEHETDYDIAPLRATPPDIAFCAQGEKIFYEGRDMIVDTDLRAAYDSRARRIFLVLPWTAKNGRALSTLLHELVHDAQMQAEWPCPQAMEWEAYQLQARWLESQGIAHGFDWFAIWRLSRCPSTVHP
ncbi:DUF6647 family protein [Rhodalgimonas zhirmunskyi]|nr:DUF6647 family protein [Rhodoalgimonas zhirmunskyi]